MTDKREAIERRALVKKEASEKSIALFERIADVVDRAHLILTNRDFASVLRAEGINSVPGCLHQQPQSEFTKAPIEAARLEEISLEFVIVWKFLFPLLTRPAIESYLERTWPNFVSQFKDVFQ